MQAYSKRNKEVMEHIKQKSEYAKLRKANLPIIYIAFFLNHHKYNKENIFIH
jgi:hypothetical protein